MAGETACRWAQLFGHLEAWPVLEGRELTRSHSLEGQHGCGGHTVMTCPRLDQI